MTVPTGTLARLGFVDPGQAQAHLQQLGPEAESLVAMLGRVADPDLALTSLVTVV